MREANIIAAQLVVASALLGFIGGVVFCQTFGVPDRETWKIGRAK